MPEKTSFFLDTKKARFFAQSSRSRGQPKKHSEKTWPRRRKMLQNVFQKIPQKNHFFWNFSEQQLWPGRKNVIFSHKEDSQNIVVFSTSESKKRRKFDPLGDGWDGMMRISTGGKEKHIRGKFPKKVVFWGFFEMETAQTWISQAIRNLEIIKIYNIIIIII